MSSSVIVRAVTPGDADGIWAVLEPVIRKGETYTLPTDMSRDDALGFWGQPAHEVFVAEERTDGAAGASRGPAIVGTYFLRGNQSGGGSHVANCGYVTAPVAQGRGVARAMCEHSLLRARERGFRAMQFNFVVSTNERAIRLWQAMGFAIVGTLPGAFHHPQRGFVDAFVMYASLA